MLLLLRQIKVYQDSPQRIEHGMSFTIGVAFFFARCEIDAAFRRFNIVPDKELERSWIGDDDPDTPSAISVIVPNFVGDGFPFLRITRHRLIGSDEQVVIGV